MKRARTAFGGGLVVLAAMAGAALPASCSEEEKTTIDVGPTDNPTIAIVSPTRDECVAVGDDPDYLVPIQIDTKDTLVLRPPGQCGIIRQCGHLRLYVAPVNAPTDAGAPVDADASADDGGPVDGPMIENNVAASSVVPLLLRKIADRYATFEVAVHVVRLKSDTNILADAGTTTEADEHGEVSVLDHAGHPLRARVEFSTEFACTPTGTGAGGGGGAGGGTGASTTGGGGGAGGAGGAGAGGAGTGTGGAGGAGGGGGAGGN